MNITDSKVKFIKDGNIYTLLQKDENSKIKFHYDDSVINIVTKQEVLNNLPNISYNDTIKIYYYLNGTCVQLAVKEDIEYPNTYELVFNNQDGFETSSNIKRDNNFTTIALLNVSKKSRSVDYNVANVELIYDSTCTAYEESIILSTRTTDETMNIIDHTTETELVSKAITQDSLLGSTLSITDLDVAKTTYELTENIDNGTYTLNNYSIQDSLLGAIVTTVDLDVTNATYDLTGDANVDDYTLENTTIQSFYSTLSYTEVEAE